MDELVLLPTPKIVDIIGGEIFKKRKNLEILIDEEFKKDMKIEVLESFVSTNLEFTILRRKNSESLEKSILLHLKKAEFEKPDRYKLSIEEEIVIESSTPRASFHGFVTLIQILSLDRIPFLNIDDWPDIKNRGVMLDISRDRVPSMPCLFRFIDQLAYLKYNEFQLYIEHTFEYPGHDFWVGSSPITPEELKLINQYCKDRFIRLVPNQNSLGHMHRIIEKPRYLHLAEKPDDIKKKRHTKLYDHAGKPGFSLCPTDPKTLDFLFGLYDSLLGCLDGCKVINIGLDEAFDLGSWRARSTPKCQSSSVGEVYFEFLRSLSEYLVTEKGVQEIQFWADMIEGFISQDKKKNLKERLPKNCVPVIWGYEGRTSKFQRMGSLCSENGIKFYVCPSTSSWNTWASRTTNYIENMSEAALQAGKFPEHCEGFLVSIWGDNGHMQANEISLGGIVAGSCVSWNVEWAEFQESEPYNTKLRKRVVEGLNVQIFKDKSRSIGQVLTNLGDCYLLVKEGNRCGGCSELFNLLVFDNDAPRTVFLRGMTKDSLARTVKHIKKYSQMIPSIDLPEEEDTEDEGEVEENEQAVRPSHAYTSEIVQRKLRWVVRIQMFACSVGYEFLKLGDEKGIEMRKWRVQDFPVEVKNEMKEELEEIIKELEYLWMLDSRIGGLKDSVGRLSHFLDLLCK